MTIEEKLILIAETLDAEQNNVKPETELKSLEEWDSMGVISTIAMLDRKFAKVLSAEQIEELKTVQDILNLMA
ncbi:MAG: acyl carrier protein [Cloacibacillus sp.]